MQSSTLLYPHRGSKNLFFEQSVSFQHSYYFLPDFVQYTFLLDTDIFRTLYLYLFFSSYFWFNHVSQDIHGTW